MKKIMVLISISLFINFSCKNEGQVKAKIFERKKEGKNKLLIKYNYVIDGKLYVDSSKIENSVIAGDSVNISIDPSNPQRGQLELKSVEKK